MSRLDLDCAAVDELAASYALGAMDAAEERAVGEHLDGCRFPHADTRDLMAAAAALPESVRPVAPSRDLRRRLMASVAETPQDHRIVTAAPRVEPAVERRPSWWQFSPMPAALAAVALAAAVGLGAWGVSVNSQLAERDAALRAIASADAIHAASGEAGSGWVIQDGEQAMFLAEDLADLPSNQLYEFWLIDGAGNAVAAGTLSDTDGVVLVTLEHGLDDAAVFAVTVESQRVEQSVNDPVMVAALEG